MDLQDRIYRPTNIYIFFSISKSHKRSFQTQMFHTSVPPLICLQIHSVTAPLSGPPPLYGLAQAGGQAPGPKSWATFSWNPGKSSWRVGRRLFVIKQHHHTAGPARRALGRLLWLPLAPGFNSLEVWGALAAPRSTSTGQPALGHGQQSFAFCSFPIPVSQHRSAVPSLPPSCSARSFPCSF